jgi:hypothetical protein
VHKFWSAVRYAAVATAFVSASLAIGSAAQAAAPQPTPAVVAQTAVKPPPATSRRITCAVRRNVWSPCLNDNAKVARSQHVYLALNSSAGRKVQFRVKDKLTGRVLASPVAKRAPNGRFFLYWTNTSARTVTVDVEARATAATSVRATLRVR